LPNLVGSAWRLTECTFDEGPGTILGPFNIGIFRLRAILSRMQIEAASSLALDNGQSSLVTRKRPLGAFFGVACTASLPP
jgi:hypothetical protein